MVRTFLGDEGGELEAVRIRMSGDPAAPDFDLSLVDRAERGEDEIELDGGGFAILIKSVDAERLDEATVDYVERVNESGFEVRLAGAVAASGGAGGSEGAPTGEIADRVRAVLESQVNPAIAAHGGAISLVEVKENDIYVEMSGGCQGCALSKMTLRQGVERMLREAVPELTGVHDITDHSSGVNPCL